MGSTDVPQKYEAIYARAMSGKSKSAGVKCMCLSCMGWVRAEVSVCTDHECPLFPYRPYRSSAQIAAAKRSLAETKPPTEQI
jgi:hypothetical protein